ncbi:MAG: type II 3-dehydroquinate dehydratase [Actinobacteria bacterium]|nr:type II 3-dehydroquinate dehydratase [Actinomycetota bacterium]
MPTNSTERDRDADKTGMTEEKPPNSTGEVPSSVEEAFFDVRPSKGLIVIMSGPNLDILGSRQPEIYGTATLEDHLSLARQVVAAAGYELRHVHSNQESKLVEAVHSLRGIAIAIIINAGALTHYSWALHDALAAYEGVVVELHLSNPLAREPWRFLSVIAPVADGTIMGFGSLGYKLAAEAAVELARRRVEQSI